MKINFYSAWFCPYAQRAWLTLEHHGIKYNYIESLTVKKDQSEGDHGYDKHPRLLQLNPKGLVPTIEFISQDESESNNNMEELKKDERVKMMNDSSTLVINDSIVCMEILNSFVSTTLKDKDNENVKNLIQDDGLLIDAKKFDKSICSTFYKILMKPNQDEQKDAFAFFAKSIAEFIKDGNIEVGKNGYYKSCTGPTIVDFVILPWLLRIPVLEHYRPMFHLEEYMSKDCYDNLNKFIERMKNLPAVKETLWDDVNVLLGAYTRYADGTAQSQVGQAVRDGKNVHDV
jgi:glutathione S-transferase